MYVIYRASGPQSNLAYYGYANDRAEALATFLGGASRPELERADVRLLQLNGGDPSVIKLEILDVADDEITAWMLRNDLRSTSCDTISGPTMFPGNIANRAKKDSPERVAGWYNSVKLRSQKTARDAYALGMWTKDQIQAASNKHGRKTVIAALDTMSPDNFDVSFCH